MGSRPGKIYANHDCVAYNGKPAGCQVGYEMQSSKCVRKGAATASVDTATAGTIGMGVMSMR